MHCPILTCVYLPEHLFGLVKVVVASSNPAEQLMVYQRVCLEIQVLQTLPELIKHTESAHENFSFIIVNK